MRAAAVAVAAALVASVAVSARSSRGDQPGEFAPRMTITPQLARVFQGNSFQFRTSIVGDAQAHAVRWSVVGPGSIDDGGLYHSPDAPASAEVVASAGNGLTDSATVRTVAPPVAEKSLLIATCYEDGNVAIFDGSAFKQLGALSLGERAAGVAIDPESHRAIVAVDSQLVTIDLRTMASRTSAPIAGARFSEVALLAWRYVAATDNNADARHPGVRIFRINRSGVPVLVSSAVAGETPEGIAVADGGRTFYVSNINSNSIARFVLDSHGLAKFQGSARTAARPFGIAVDPIRHFLFVADNDTATLSGSHANPGLEHFELPGLHRIGSIVSTGSKSSLPLGVAVDAGSSRLFVTNEGDHDVAVFSIPALRRIATLPVGLTPWLPAFDQRHHRLYVPNAREGSISLVDTRTLRAVAPDLTACAYPTSVSVFNSPDSGGT